MRDFDFLIIGGGIFGAFSALVLAEKKYTVCLVEKEKKLLSKASRINQCRLHNGYHYPRSFETAQMASEYFNRFVTDHREFINKEMHSYYAIEKKSLTSSHQFEHFCSAIGIPAQRIKNHSLFDHAQLEAVYKTKEYAFDSNKLSEYYAQKLIRHAGITILNMTHIVHSDRKNDHWWVQYRHTEHHELNFLTARCVINASYAGTNAVHKLFNQSYLPLEYKISEIAIMKSESLNKIGLTVMDGPFVSIFPFGQSGWMGLSSVPYTHHRVSEDSLPEFECQKLHTACRAELLSNCTICPHRPGSNQHRMVAQLRQYLKPNVDLQYIQSLWAMKAILQTSNSNDGRPTQLSRLSTTPGFYTIFAGKISSIYEIEKYLHDEF